MYDHQDIHIGGSEGSNLNLNQFFFKPLETILAVGTLEGPPKSEVYQGGRWEAIEDYPFHEVMWRNAVIFHNGNFERKLRI